MTITRRRGRATLPGVPLARYRPPIRLRTALTTGLSAAALLVLTSCGGADSDTASGSSSSASSSGAAETTTEAPADDEFCGQAETALGSINEAVLTAQTDPTQLSAALQSAADELGAITPPEEIATDWQTLVGGASQLAQGTAGLDITTPEGQQQVAAQLTQLNTTLDPASQNVQTYLTDTCGIADTAPTAATATS